MDWGLSGKTVVVTGAAGGIGTAITNAFQEAGSIVYGLDLSWEAERDRPRTVEVDVTDTSAIAHAFGRVKSDTGSLDVLVNNAGLIRVKDFDQYDEADWTTTMTVNAAAVFLCSQQAVPYLAESDGGSIVNLASVAGRNGQTLSPPYAASKAAVINITRSSALRLAARGIRVNAVAPGLIDTEFNYRLGRQLGPSEGLTPEEYVARRAAPIPIGRIGTGHDVASVIRFLASPHASYVTGQTLNVDGGLVLS